MVVGVAVVEVHVEDAQSLKAKRGVIRSIAGRVQSRFNVSVAEVGGQGTWQRATIGLAMAGNEEVSVRRNLTRVVDFIEKTHLAQVLESDIEVLRMPLVMESGGAGEEAEAIWPWTDEEPEGQTSEPESQT
jgi:uncharacterized protein YlxP (DUF503 family)